MAYAVYFCQILSSLLQVIYCWGHFWLSKRMMRRDKRNTLMDSMREMAAVPAAGVGAVDLSLDVNPCQVSKN